MIKTLCKHGNTCAPVIDKPILELLRATPERPFELPTDRQSLLLIQVRNSREGEKFKDGLAMVHSRFGRAMKKLAEQGAATLLLGIEPIGPSRLRSGAAS